MPVFQLKHPDGRTLTVRGDVAPEDDEIDELFAVNTSPEVDFKNQNISKSPGELSDEETLRNYFKATAPFSFEAPAPLRQNPAVVGVAGENIPQPTGEAAEILSSPSALVQTPFTVLGKPINAALQDVGATIAGQPELGGNLYELFTREEPVFSGAQLPYQRTLADISKSNPIVATVGKVAAGLIESSPMLATFPQGSLGKLAALGFTADMLANSGESAKRLGEELGKPEKERDYDKITTSLSEIAQTAAFAPLAGVHGAGRAVGERVAPNREAVRALAEQLKSKPTPRATIDEAAQIRSGLPPRAATPEMLPELQRTKELVDAAIQEATQKIVEPGKTPAIEQLKAQGAEIVPVEPRVQKPQTGFERPAEEVMRGKTVAEKPLPQEVSDAVVKEAAQPVRDVREVAAESQTQVPTEVSRAAADEGGRKEVTIEPPKGDRLVEIVDKDGNVSIGAFGDKFYDMTAIGKGKIASVARRVNDSWSHGTLAPGETIREINRAADVTQPPTPQPESAKAASLETPASTVVPNEPVTPKVTEGKPADIITKLESLKSKPSEGSQLFSLPHPDAIKTIGKQLWNDAIDVAISAVKAGRAVRAAIAEAVAHIKRNARNYDENQLRKNLESVLADEKLVSTSAESPKASESTAESGGGIVVPEGQKARSFSARATVSEKVPEPVREQIKTDERSVYTPQNVPETVAEVSGLDSSKLAGMSLTDNRFTASKLELADRLFKAGDNEGGLKVIQDAAQELTKAGQIINQAKLLNALKPEVQVLVTNEGLKKAGKDPLTPQQQKEALELGRASQEAKSKLDAATEAWKKTPTPENAKAAEDALIEANQKALDAQKFHNAYQPKYTSSLLKAILQGNLITPISQVANLFGNMSFVPFRATGRGIAAAMDMLESAATGRKRTSSVGPISGTVEAAKGFGRGAARIPEILKKGTGNVVLGEDRQGIQPIKAWMNQFSKNPQMPTTGGKLTVKDRLNLLLEGTIGIPAEMMLRGLGAGDQPFREAAKARVTAEQLRLNNVPKDQWGFAQKFPELFFDGDTLQKIKDNTDYSVFQRQSKTLNMLTRWIASKGPVFDFAVATVAPFKQTPWNIIGEILSYNPVVAFAKGVYAASKGNRVEANLNAGKMVVGTLLTTAGYTLYKNGLLSPSLDSRDETMKERILLGQVMPPNHVNISGLDRWRKGGSPEFKPGDKTVDIMRSGGLAGAFFYMTANVGRDLEKSPQSSNSDLLKSILTQSTLEQARFGMNQSFLSGVEGLLSAVKDGNADSYVKTWANTVTSIPLPNTLTTLSRATREYKPDFSSEKLDEKIKNVFRNRLGWAGADDYLPLKRGLWGEPLRETPKDRNALIYHFFDVSRGQQITDDPKTLEIYRLWRKTDDSRAIPTPVSNRLTVRGNNYMLTPEQQSSLAELVGENRRRIADAVIAENPNWHTLTDENKIKLLQKVYDKGADIGKAKFMQQNEGKLTEKPKKAGFQIP